MPKPVMKVIQTVSRSILNLMQMPKPVLACVHGSVAGVGMSFMMACDLVIAAENTNFTVAYTGIGACPDGGSTYNLPRHVGNKKAMEWLLLSDVFDARTAQAHGLINWVVPAEKLAEETERILRKLAHGPTKSYEQVKKLLNQTWRNSLEVQLEAEGRGFEICSTTQDFKSGVTSFLEKKKPEFKGS
jgi:2-(1,2-epoxy-1,2-dihydrophenyl)acetyl-CoA isomerase